MKNLPTAKRHSVRSISIPVRRPNSHRSSPVVYDLFAGAGLFSFAFQREGFRIERAIELDGVAAETYRAQVGNHIMEGDIRDLAPTGHCDVLIAGPPCQGFSTLGRRAHDDPRNSLSLEVARWAFALHPRVVVVENVAAFARSLHHELLTDALQAAGYRTQTILLDAVCVGVAQHRERSFTFASLSKIPTVEPAKVPIATVAEALYGLPMAADGRNQHFAPKPGLLALARMRLIPEGGDKRDVMRRNPRLAPRSWVELGCHVTDAWGRMRWDEPSNTLRTCFNNASKGRYIHPEADRVISLREAARLHSIPDSWTFAGWPHEIARQIGNSVPPLVGRAIARAVFSAL